MISKAQHAHAVCETSRLVLRRFRADDAEAILAFRGDPQVMRFSVTGPETLEEVRLRYLPACLRRYARDGMGQWAVVRKVDGLLVGECGICVQALDGECAFEISYRIRRDCWGSGLATEAARACRDYGFGEFRLRRLISIIEPENSASIRVAIKVGMALERSAAFHGIPVLIYSLDAAAAGA